MIRLERVLQALEDEYWEWAEVELAREYVKGAKYIDDVVAKLNLPMENSENVTLKEIKEADKTKLDKEIKNLWPLHVEAAKALINSSKMYVKASIDWTKQAIITSLQKVQQEKVRELLAQSSLVGSSIHEMKKNVISLLEMEKVGWFRDRWGKRWTMERYVDMLVRTETKIANTQWTINRAIQLWITKFKIIEHADCCKICDEYNWMIVDISQWTAELPPYHPNCRGYIIAQL